MFFESKPNLLGTGAFSRVYRGVRNSDGDAVAIKSIDCANLSKRGRSKLNEEIRICKELEHPFIVKTYDVTMDHDMDYMYIVLELCDCDLREYLKRKRRPMSEKETLRYMKQLMSACQYLRSKDIIHRDLKPQNILMKNHKVKIADFGMARCLTETQMANTMCGSPLYMAPEVLNHMDYSDKADLWSLGMIMYEMLYGVHPFQHIKTPFHLKHQINQSDSVKLGKNRKISRNARNLLRGLLEKQVDKRMTWSELFMHEWFAESVKVAVVPPPQPSRDHPLSFSQEVEHEQYGDFRIELGMSTVDNDEIEIENSESDDDNEDDDDDEPSGIGIVNWRHHIVDDDYYYHTKSEPIMTYTVINERSNMDDDSSLKDTLITYVSTSYDLLRSSIKYFNSL